MCSSVSEIRTACGFEVAEEETAGNIFAQTLIHVCLGVKKLGAPGRPGD
jgi:hypothetical protein